MTTCTDCVHIAQCVGYLELVACLQKRIAALEQENRELEGEDLPELTKEIFGHEIRH